MGMGDVKRPYQPPTFRARCDVDREEYDSRIIRSCPHPAVISRYGRMSGKANVSIYQCRKCQFGDVRPFDGSVGCNYESEVKAGANDRRLH